MKTILVANQKGGVGKSIASYNLAHFYADRGRRVLFIDADTQGNSTTSMKKHLVEVRASQFFGDAPLTFPATPENLVAARADEDGLKAIERMSDDMGAVLVKRLRDRLADASTRFDICVVDTPGSNALSVGAFLLCATHVLIPTEIDTYSLNVAIKMLRRIVGVQQTHNKELVNLGLLPSRLKTGAVNQRRDLEMLLRDYGQYVLRACICDRMPYKEAADEGVPVWKYTRRQKRDASGAPQFDGKNRPIMERVSNEQAASEMLGAFELINTKVGG